MTVPVRDSWSSEEMTRDEPLSVSHQVGLCVRKSSLAVGSSMLYCRGGRPLKMSSVKTKDKILT